MVKPTLLFMLKAVSLLAFIFSISPEQPKQKPEIRTRQNPLAWHKIILNIRIKDA